MYKPENIEKEAQLLKGIGASSWFYVCCEEKYYRIKRYSEEGRLECSGIFSVDDLTFNINQPFTVTYISHCKECTILQKNKKYIFKLQINAE